MEKVSSINGMFENNLLMDILFSTFLWFLIIGSIISLLFGMVLFFNPNLLIRVNKKLNKWYSFRKSMKPLEIMRNTDKFIYRYNKLFGWIAIAGSLFSLYIFVFKLPMNLIPQANTLFSVVASIAMQSLRWLFMIFIPLGLPLWILLIFNPEKVIKISQLFNRWISTRKLFLPMTQMNTIVDSIVLKFNRGFALFFIFGSVYILYTFM